ncbi:M1 family metallopeptidase [Olivibacter ginsenosidimutans]
MKQFPIALVISSFFLYTPIRAQFDPSKIFQQDFYKFKGDPYRSASGKPGPHYWQNQADYQVKASFDTTTLQLKGDVHIHYSNNSPDPLDELWLQLDQNNTLTNSRANRMHDPNVPADPTTGYQITQVRLKQGSDWETIPYLVDDTRMQIRLANRPVKAGDKIELDIQYTYVLQASGGGGRSGYLATKNGRIFEFSYWYPRMCVYDDYYGWNTLPFIGSGEMYLDYSHVDYSVTVPANLVVVGAGELINGQDILSQPVRNRLTQARQSDKTVPIRSAADLTRGVTQATKGEVTWHFQMQNTRDVAWAMSTAFLWDAAKINLPEGKTALAQSVYPLESTQDSLAWGRSTEMIKASIEHYSKKWFPFPYTTATSVAGPVGGMEFPGLAFNHWQAKPYIMYLLASHEIGHTWFPMIVGSDERRYPFMDEGFNTFLNVLAQEEFNDGEFAPKRDGEYAPGGGNPADEIIQVIATSGEANTLMTRPDAMDRKYVHPLAYFKSAFGLTLLRDVILGPDKFDYAFRQYIHHWAFKHPRPEDFFRSMENGAGEDLSWFWCGWYYHNWQLDQAISSVNYTDNESTKGIDITVANQQQMVMPILVEVNETNGKIHQFTVPVEVWQQGATTTFHVPTTSEVTAVTIDPQHRVPDVDRTNNVWKPKR